jgi:PRC-barrel domain protein
VARLGARLADAEGFHVVALDGHVVGEVEHVRYKRHADHPDEIVISRRVLFWRRRGVIPFDAVGNVDPDRERIYLTIPTDAIKRLTS